MKRITKIVSILLVLCMTAALLAGCSGGSGSGSSTPASTAGGGNSTAAGGGETGGEEPTGETPHYEIIAILNTATEDINDNPFYQQIAADAGVDISFECIQSDWSTKKAALLAGNDLPDAFIGWQCLTNSDVSNNAVMFANLQDLITDENTPNLKAWIESDDVYRSAITDLNGGIYFLSDKMLFRPETFEVTLINTDWLEALNLEMPTTIDELEQVLIAFRDGDPNGNGENDELPLYMDPIGTPFTGAFGAQNSYSCDFRLRDGKVEYVPTTENWKNYAAWMHHLYEEELIPEECATLTWSTMSARMGNDIPIVGVVSCWIKDPLNIAYQDSYDAVPVLKGPNGDQFYNGNRENSEYDGVPKFVMSAECENKEGLMRWVDQFFIPINAAQAAYGPIGVTLTEEDGKLTINDPPEGMDYDTWKYKYAISGGVPTMGGDAVESLFTALTPADQMKLGFDEIYSPYVDRDNNVPSLKFTEEESQELAIIQTDVDTYKSTAFTDWFVNGGVEENWDSYLQEMENLGLSRYTEIYQAAYERTLG